MFAESFAGAGLGQADAARFNHSAAMWQILRFISGAWRILRLSPPWRLALPKEF